MHDTWMPMNIHRLFRWIASLVNEYSICFLAEPILVFVKNDLYHI